MKLKAAVGYRGHKATPMIGVILQNFMMERTLKKTDNMGRRRKFRRLVLCHRHVTQTYLFGGISRCFKLMVLKPGSQEKLSLRAVFFSIDE